MASTDQVDEESQAEGDSPMLPSLQEFVLKKNVGATPRATPYYFLETLGDGGTPSAVPWACKVCVAAPLGVALWS